MEFLKEHLGDELYNQVVAKLNGNDKVKLANLAEGGYVGKEKFTTLETTHNDLKTQLTDRDKQLETLKAAAGDNEKLKQEIIRLQGVNTQAITDAEAKVKQMQLDHSIDAALIKAGAVNTTAVKALLDGSKLSLDTNGNLIGADEQIKGLQEKEKWAFTQPAVPGAGANPPAPGTENKELPKGVQMF